MPKVSEVCHVRSKNAGPFWITIDLFFHSEQDYLAHVDSASLEANAIGDLFDVNRFLVKRFPVANLRVLKISYPRSTPQGGAVERDMHGGQQYVRLLDLEL